MHVIVIGGGVIGIASAWALQDRGHTVEVFESGAAAGQETSFANGGMLTAGMCEPWNTPGVWKDLLASFFDAKSPMKMHLSAIPSLSLWGLQFLAQSTRRRFRANTEASYRLCQYSVKATDRWVAELGLDCDYRSGSATPISGDLKIFSSRESAAFSLELLKWLEPMGLNAHLLDRDDVLALEPALASIADTIDCGIHYPEDPAGDACRFSTQLADRLVAAGGVVHYNRPVTAILRERNTAVGVAVENATCRADAVVVAAARRTPHLVRPLGIRLPIRPVKGYSLTIDIAHVDAALRPGIAVINQPMHAAVNPLGERIRVAGTAEFTRRAEPVLSPARVSNLMDLLQATFPDIAARVTMEHATPWCGFRPMSADGKPFVGPSGVPGLFINSGHGYLGWTQAVGSALMLADQLEGRPTELDATPFAVRR